MSSSHSTAGTTFTPAELVMTGAAVGLNAAGISSDQFIAAAPLAACRLCGAVYQTRWHRELYWSRVVGLEDEPNLLATVLDLGNKWRETHTTQNHTQDEIDKLTRTGAAFTPEAANVLAPFGIIPLGNMSQEIMDGMYEAPRAPDLTKLEGGE